MHVGKRLRAGRAELAGLRLLALHSVPPDSSSSLLGRRRGAPGLHGRAARLEVIPLCPHPSVLGRRGGWGIRHLPGAPAACCCWEQADRPGQLAQSGDRRGLTFRMLVTVGSALRMRPGLGWMLAFSADFRCGACSLSASLRAQRKGQGAGPAHTAPLNSTTSTPKGRPPPPQGHQQLPL